MKTTADTMPHREYEKLKGIRIKDNTGYVQYGYTTQEEANEFARLYCFWWGSNLVYLGAEQKNDLYFPKFNVWD